MFELISSPQIIGLLAGAFSLIAGISLIAYFLERKHGKTHRPGK